MRNPSSPPRDPVKRSTGPVNGHMATSRDSCKVRQHCPVLSARRWSRSRARCSQRLGRTRCCVAADPLPNQRCRGERKHWSGKLLFVAAVERGNLRGRPVACPGIAEELNASRSQPRLHPYEWELLVWLFCASTVSNGTATTLCCTPCLWTHPISHLNMSLGNLLSSSRCLPPSTSMNHRGQSDGCVPAKRFQLARHLHVTRPPFVSVSQIQAHHIGPWFTKPHPVTHDVTAKLATANPQAAHPTNHP
jgi:hypothetical protein